ncbi:b(0,+)-type amino acid transporter 1-like [Mizuhopecten yessoensis]|uniref:b(0,+)-type amino acid transporter 1 n=1 Tax=Mizuhopecten yessoensis TaxID=6573 RepID=A0A210QHF0_MIZYE|nr:b(0,+)-type amino acid transporter 1-like [Mizuhopecten yessoensis]OWF48193.1 B(0,+)-type amino acid transporter 1 [Mizuhopecten yessoensis]
MTGRSQDHVSHPKHQNGLHNGNHTNGYHHCPPDAEKRSGSVHELVTPIELKKNMGLMSGTALIVGTMIGSGIFVSPRGVLEGSGSIGMSLVVWASCGLLAMFGALTYAELGTVIQESGGEHAYFKRTFMPMGRFGRLPVFLFDWLGVFVLRPSMFAIMALSLGTYATQPWYGDCEAPTAVIKTVTIMSMALAGFINAMSVHAALLVQNTLTATKLMAAAIIIIGGIVKIAQGSTVYISEGFKDTKEDLSLLALSFYNGLWAYDGWNNLNLATAELKNPSVNLPRSIIIGIPLTTVVYILVNVGYFSVMSKEEVLHVDAVAVIWGQRVLGDFSFIIPICVVLSCFGAVNGTIFTSGRLTYVAAKDHHLPNVLSYIHVYRKTPLPSVIFTTIIGIILILPGDLSSLIEFFSFSAWIFYGLAALTAIILRFTEPDLPRPYRVPLVIPCIVVLASIYLLVAPIVNNPRIEYLYPLMFTAAGLAVYVPCVHFRYSPRWIHWVTVSLQKLLLIFPTDTY